MTFTRNQGVRINYRVEGAGSPLVLYHSFSQSLDLWYDNGYVDALKQTYQLILIDSRGHGASEKLYTPEAYSLEALATDVVAVLDALGVDQTHYFGYSLGGWVGFGLAKYAPQRVCSLTIGGAQPYGQSMAPYRAMLQGGLESCLALLETAAGFSLPEPARQRFRQNDDRALLAAYANDRPDISEILPAMTMPCLLFGSEEDPLLPAIERCAAELPQITCVVWPGLNHIQLGIQIKAMLPHLTSFLTTAPVQNTKPCSSPGNSESVLDYNR